MTADAAAESFAALQAFAKNLGLAFQIIDDLLDVEGDPAITGKPVREDLKKTTFVSFSGPPARGSSPVRAVPAPPTPRSRRSAAARPAARALGVRRRRGW